MKTRRLALAIALGGLVALQGRSETASHYVQEGLLACWDGVENAGARTHDAGATAWRDLVAGRAFDLTGVTVGANGMEFAGTANSYGILSAADTAATFERATNGTLEVVYSSRDTSGHHALLQSSKTANSAMGFWSTSHFIASNQNTLWYTCPISTATNTMTVRYAQAMPTDARANGEALATGTRDGWANPKETTTIGTRSSFANCHFSGTIFSIRVYDRPLTDAEIAANRALDVRRFIDGITYDGGCLVISGSRGDAGSATPAYGSSYPGIQDGYRLPVSAAPAVTNAAGDISYVCTGWRLCGEDGALIDDGPETAFTYVHAGGTATRTLEWQWRAEYKVAATADAGGSAAVAAPWVAEGAEAVFTATPDAGRTFRYWVDEGDVILTRENPLAIAVDEPRTLRAVFGDASVSGWTYAPAARTLTQNVPAGETPWVLTAAVVSDGTGTNLAVSAVTTVGSPTVLDFSGPLTDGGDTRYRIQSLDGFASRTTIKYVVLPAGLETLGQYAFRQCTGLTTVEPLLPDTLTKLGLGTFAGCAALRGDPVFPANTITATSTYVSGTVGWFNGSQITSCDMSAATMTAIAQSSFAGCSQLKWVKLPQGVHTFGGNCFDNCPELESITPFLPSGVTYIGQAAFYRCPKLTGDLVLAGDAPVTLTHHNNNGFGIFQGSKITSATMTAPITATCGQMFYGCTSLTNAVLPDTLETLYGSDFSGCTALANVTPFLPSSLKSIGRESFRGCTSLAIPLTLTGANDIAISENYQGNWSFYNAAIPSATITAPLTDIGGTYNTGKNAHGGLFQYAQHLGEVLLPPTVRYVRASSFASCTALTNVVFTGDVPDIASSAFSSVTDYAVRLFVPRFNETWEAFLATNANFAAMNATLEAQYRAKYPTGVLPNGCLTISSRHVWISDKQYEGGRALYVAGSPYRIGAVEPYYGLAATNLADGATVVCTAPATAVYNGVRYACRGSVLDTEFADRVFANPVTNAGTTRVVAQTGNEVKRLVWLWEQDGFALDTSAVGIDGGTVVCDPANTGPYASNTVVAVTAAPREGYRFVGWVGDVPGGFDTNATISVTMDGARAVHPLYAGPWLYNGSNQITDGNWVLTVSQTSGTSELKVTAVVSVRDETVLHLGMPVEDEGGAPYAIISVTGFANRAGLRFVFLPDGLRELGKLAFYTCTALERVEPLLPSALTELGQCAFSLCTSLRGAPVFPAHAITSTYSWSNDTRGWFNSTQITSCDMSAATMTEIVAGSFYDCRQLKWVKLPQGVTSYGGECFRKCSELESITPFLPYGVTSIGAAAFLDSPKLVGDLVLAGVAPLTLTHHSNNGYGIFQGCSSLTSATITAPATVTCGQMFLNCSSITNLVLPDTLERLYGSDFSGCSALTGIVLPEPMDSIGNNTFQGCSALTNVYFRGTVPTTRNPNAFYGQAANKIRVFVPSDDPAWTQDFYGANVTPMDETLRVAYRAIFPAGKMAKGQFTWSTKMWFCTWDPHASRTIIILR